ncbi:N-acyl-aromatic-L-amino acid amidohydrolase (carboxylate-forming) B [Salmo salar]|uniref:N-acyl-aromatic-L-amino acid amidohydrolase n=1 Tax=Salmo salar TaxID=8030 RepID=A0A1S3N778_SALSA|nr:N-acyl-aromatic-L-amino acid amidohydrolase (carboxylate-forming) B [Salmo salar]XP_045556516.1 N-acyl-aromatic-L-amino acid amidohydrolase (carboxylate-forming) B [Salmo salar]|eukprot:XP_014010921.1 PREDICTED: N-acyl-aromatic-L-amino acid amidohydrolase (carboxylate-forming) B-like [Salmo salar]
MEGREVVLPTVSRVALCGGTHGNELSGVYLVRERLKRKRKVEEEDHISLVTVMSNPRAVQQCQRYTETDLNRCFTHATLSGPVTDKTPYEIVRSQELNTLLGPKGSPEAMDLVCDLHNTTANMGLCLIAYSDCDWISLHIYRYLQRQMSDIPVRFIHFDLPLNEAYSLDSVGKHGFAIEIGPQAHGVVRSNILSTMQEGVQHMLEWVHLFNSGTQFEGGKVDVYTMVKNVDYPRDFETCGITAAIHPQLQDRDFCLLRPNDPVFQTFSGETLKYKGTEPLYPFFINECAYYEKGIALSLARQRSVGIPSIRSEREGEQRKRKSSAEEMEEEEEIKGEMEEEGCQKLMEYGEESDSLNGQYN